MNEHSAPDYGEIVSYIPSIERTIYFPRLTANLLNSMEHGQSIALSLNFSVYRYREMDYFVLVCDTIEEEVATILFGEDNRLLLDILHEELMVWKTFDEEVKMN